MSIPSTGIDTSVVANAGQALMPSRSKTGGDAADFVLDSQWSRSAFLINDVKMAEDIDTKNRYWSSASSKFTDTRIGGSLGINAKPQFTRYADIRHPGRMKNRQKVSLGNTVGNYGMGRYYSEAIDDPSQTVYLTFGVPQYNSITNFITNAFDSNLTSMARTGRGPSLFYTAGKFIGTVGVIYTFPLIAMGVYAGKLINSLFTRPSSKYYTIKPTMPMYWSVVNLLVNTLAVNRGLLPKILEEDKKQQEGTPFRLETDQAYLDMLNSLMPDVFTGKDSNGLQSNTIDVYAVANKAQRIANRLAESEFNALNKQTTEDAAVGYVRKDMGNDGSILGQVSDSDGKNPKPSLAAQLNRMVKLGTWFNKEKGETEKQELSQAIDPATGKARPSSYFQSFREYFDAEFNDGSQFAMFKVAHTGPVQEAFGNAVAESDISQKLNGISSQARQARFSFADGNLAGDLIGSTLGAVKDLAVGVLDGVTMSNIGAMLTGMAGSGYVDIPKTWQSSSAQLPRSTYKMELISPYGNIISQIQNIYLPLCMILAGTLPLSTGKQSYTSPFLCRLFDRGRCQVQLGMIESLSISRGTSNLAFDLKGHALALEVTFTIVDMSSIMHMPVSAGGGSFLSTMDEDNILVDYLAVLAGQDIYSQVYPLAKARLNLAKWLNNKAVATSPAYIASTLHESMVAGKLQYFFGVGHIIDGLSRGTDSLSRS